MADNITLSSGQVVRSDDIGGVHWPAYKMAVGADGSATLVEPPTDAQTAASIIPAGGMVFDGANWQRARAAAADGQVGLGIQAVIPMKLEEVGGNFERNRAPSAQFTILASAARTATTPSSSLTNRGYRGVTVFCNVTVAGTSTLQVFVELASAPNGGGIGNAITLTAAKNGFIHIYPGNANLAPAGGAVDQITYFPAPLPRDWRVNTVKGDASSWTYSVTAWYHP
jgi:hypothetical protein